MTLVHSRRTLQPCGTPRSQVETVNLATVARAP
jgi:hypothetical protein